MNLYEISASWFLSIENFIYHNSQHLCTFYIIRGILCLSAMSLGKT